MHDPGQFFGHNIYVHTALCLASAQQERCGSIGESTELAGTASRAQMFYLDTANPASCTGNITSWRVCYYGPDSVNDRGSYWATYAVYRRTGSGNNNNYGRVSEVFRATRAISGLQGESNIDGEIIQGGFNCYDDSIDVGRVNDQISDTRLIRTPAQPIRVTWGSGLGMITYLSPYEDCTPAMAIEVPLVLVWQARIHAVRTHQWSDTLTFRRICRTSMS